MLQVRFQFSKCAIHAFARGFFVASEGGADRLKVLLFKIAEQDGGAIFCVELVDRLVQNGSNQGEIGCGMIFDGIHFNCLSFPGHAPSLRPHGFASHKTSVPMQPATQHHVG